MKKTLTVAALAALSFTAHAQTMDKAAVEKIVREYIAANGEQLVASIENAQSREQQKVFNQMIRPHTPVRGPKDAPVTVVEFSEYECPFCGRVQPTLAELQKLYGTKVRWAYKHLPLDFHKMAKPAAYASMAAHEQGKFWEYSKLIWAGQRNLNDTTLVNAAKALKLDMAKFEAARTSQRIKDMVETDMRDAKAMGASGTPYFAINGKGISGALPLEAFRQIIDAELAAKAKK